MTDTECMEPMRIQLKRMKGWKMPENTVKVDRTSPWGNPFTPDMVAITGPNAGKPIGVARAVEAFENVMKSDLSKNKKLREALLTLRGKNLACWCRVGAPCHADILLKLANAK